MKVYVVYSYGNSDFYDDWVERLEKIFSSREAAERFVMGDPVSDMFSKIEVADCPGVTWYYFMETPVYRIEEHAVED